MIFICRLGPPLEVPLLGPPLEDVGVEDGSFLLSPDVDRCLPLADSAFVRIGVVGEGAGVVEDGRQRTAHRHRVGRRGVEVEDAAGGASARFCEF